VIMPHNIYLHSALVQSRQVDRGRKSKVIEANKYFAVEAAIALAVSFIINLTVVAVFAKGFFSAECAPDGNAWVCDENSVCSCAEVGLLNAGDALYGAFGRRARFVWAIGLLAAGQSSTMTGTYAGQFVMEGFLELKLPAWKRVMFTRTIALGPAVLVALASSSDSTAGDTLDQWLNILQSVQLPFALLPVLHFTSQNRIMGDFKNGRIVKAIVWILAVAVVVINIYLIASFLTNPSNPTPRTWWFYTFVLILAFFYFVFIGYIIKGDVISGFQYLASLRTESTGHDDEYRVCCFYRNRPQVSPASPLLPKNTPL